MVSDNFINICKEPANSNRLGIITDNNEILLNQDNYIQDFTIDDGCYVNGAIIGTTYVKKLNANFIGSYDIELEDKDLKVKVGVKYDDNTEEYIDLGKYVVEKPKDEATKNYSQITAYDHTMNKLNHAYICNLDFSTPKTFSDLYSDLCNNLGLTPKSLIFDNSDMSLIGNPFTNGEKNREVLQTIEKVSCTFSQINNETNEIELCWLSQNVNPDYIFTLDDYTNLNGGKIVYGPINSLVIKNSQIDDENVSISDEESIAQNGEHQLVISEDYLLYTPELRQQAINAIWNKVHNLTYVDCELETLYGKPFLKIGDKIRIYKDEENYFDTYVLTHQFKYDGSFYSKITSPVLTKKQIQTKQDVSLGEILKNAMVTVSKIAGEIDMIAQQSTEATEQVAQIKIDNEQIATSVSSIEKVMFNSIAYELTADTTFQDNKDYYLLNENNEYIYLEKETDYQIGEEITIEIYEKIVHEGIEDRLVKNEENISNQEKIFNNTYQEIISKTIEIENSVTQIQTDTYTKTEINTKLSDGSVTKVQTVAGTFDENGMHYEKTDSKTSSTINQAGVEVKEVNTDKELLFAGYDEEKNISEVRTENMTVRNYLVCGTHARFEEYDGGWGLFIV